MGTKHVVVLPYDAAWAQDFAAIRAEIEDALGDLALRIEHVGSTSVPGLSAKPIINIDVVIRDYSVFSEVMAALRGIGYEYEGNLGIPQREAFRYDGKEHLRKHHLYVCPAESAELKRHLAFRDYLRSHPEAAAEYGRVKEEGARLYPYDIDGYIKYKSPFIEEIYQKISGQAGKAEFSHFSGVFGVYDRTAPIVTGSAGLADKSFTVPNDPAYSYQTASGTKGFTAAAILMLAAEGRLRLDDCVKALLTNSADPQKYGSLDWLSETVTVRSLLAHTSGVPDYFDESTMDGFEDALAGTPNYDYERPEQFFGLTEAVWEKQEKPYAAQGSFRYSNGGFVILAAVAEAVTGLAFPDAVQKYVFGPCGMDHSGFFRLDEQAPTGVVRATAYQENGRSNIYAVPVIGGGDGGAYTNPADMARFWNGLDPEIHPESAAAALISEAWTPIHDGDDNLYGLGFWVSRKDPRIVCLEGFDPGVQFFSFYNRDTKRSLTICLNDESMNCDEVFARYYPMVE